MRCETCGLAPPPKPACPMCLRSMDDWPDDPEMFLSSRGWEPAHHCNGAWMEPLERCTFEVTDETIADAEKALAEAEKYLSFPSVQKNGSRREQAEATVQAARDRLESLQASKEAGERLPVAMNEVKVFRGTDRMGEVVTETVVRPEKRNRAQWPLFQAVRIELNRGLESLPPRKRTSAKFSSAAMLNAEHSYLMKDKGNLSLESRAKLNRMAAETTDYHEEQCVTCRRWPDAK